MNNALEAMLAKAAQEQDVKKKAHSLVTEGDAILDDLAKSYAAEHEVTYYEAYEMVTTKDALGIEVLKHREEAARFIEAEPSIN